MYAYVEKPKKNKSQAATNSIAQKKSNVKQALGFVDNCSSTAQLKQLQGMMNPLQRKEKPNGAGLPDNLKSGMESLSGLSLDHVKVHYNSSRPAALQAHAYAQGVDIHLASGQEKHLPHELGHVLQQARGRVKPTTSVEGMAVNDNAGLESEATQLGARALQRMPSESVSGQQSPPSVLGNLGAIQLKGVGGTKIAFEKRTNEHRQLIIANGMTLLEGAWQEAKKIRKAVKDRVSRDMADYDKAVKDGDQKTTKRLDLENDRRNRPVLYQAKDQHELALNAHLTKIKDLQNQFFHDVESQRIFNQQVTWEGVKALKPTDAQKVEVAKAKRNIMEREQMRALSVQTADLNKKQKSAEAALQKSAKSVGLTQLYYDSVSTQIRDEKDYLTEATAFKNGSLSLANDEITYHHDGVDVVIADLRKGEAAYTPSTAHPAPNQQREVYHKKGLEHLRTRDGSPKEYVKDSRNKLTRRYAYVEKNYFQMMEFFMVGHMTGRFQQYMLAGAERQPGVHKITTKMIENVQTQPTSQLSDTQVAVAHQMYGSLPEQRGVSLTSTPKVGVTYANTGGNFRTNDGFKLKIDLARVPDYVLFLNHYAEGGVSDMTSPDFSTRQSHKKNPYDYKYKESAAHARELFLEHIRPEWVVEIEHHAEGGFGNVQGKKAVLGEGNTENLLEAAKTAFGGNSYEKGFEVGLQNGSDNQQLKNNTDYAKGKGTGKMVKNGYDKGRQVLLQKGQADSSVAFKEIMEDASIQDEMSPYHIGYAQGRTGQAMMNSVLEFRTLLNTDMEFKDASGMGGTYAIAHDADKLIIKRAYTTPMGPKVSKVKVIPFDELRAAERSYEEDRENVNITIKTKSGDYSLTLVKAQAESFTQTLQKYLEKNARQTTAGEISNKEDSYSLFLDAENLKIEHHSIGSMGRYKFDKSAIALGKITEVVFEKSDGIIEVTLDYGRNSYQMNLNRAEAIKIRTLLLRNKLSPKIVGDIPD